MSLHMLWEKACSEVFVMANWTTIHHINTILHVSQKWPANAQASLGCKQNTNKQKQKWNKKKEGGDYFCVNIPFKFLFSLAVVVIQAGPKPGMSHLFFLCRTVLIYFGSSTLMHAWSLNNPDTQTEMKDSLLSSCSCQIFGWQRSRKVPSSHQGGHHLLHVCVHACMCVRAWLHVCVCIWISSNVCGWVGACILACVCGVSFCLGNGFCSYSTCP